MRSAEVPHRTAPHRTAPRRTAPARSGPGGGSRRCYGAGRWVSATVGDTHTIQALVAAGLGISLMGELALRVHLSHDLVYRPLSDWPLRNTYALLWPDMVSVPAVATVLAEIRRAARTTLPWTD
ncbi:substrate-binding domain-containing protein [Streptomyces sp. NBC_01190]|nr:substrate-binding domain-containing protein [Streptomyces sp. NBC_01190]